MGENGNTVEGMALDRDQLKTLVNMRSHKRQGIFWAAE
jgi:hypothetical protein